MILGTSLDSSEPQCLHLGNENGCAWLPPLTGCRIKSNDVHESILFRSKMRQKPVGRWNQTDLSSSVALDTDQLGDPEPTPRFSFLLCLFIYSIDMLQRPNNRPGTKGLQKTSSSHFHRTFSSGKRKKGSPALPGRRKIQARVSVCNAPPTTAGKGCPQMFTPLSFPHKSIIIINMGNVF